MKSYADAVNRLRKVIQMEKTVRKKCFSPGEQEHWEGMILSIKRQIPEVVIQRHERLSQRGRKPISAVKNSVCTACHLQLPPVWCQPSSTLMPACPHCGTLLYWESPKVELSETDLKGR